MICLAAAAATLALVHANVVDVRTGKVAMDQTVLVAGTKIAAIGSAAPPAGAKVLDAAGKYLVPGLIDAHTHLATLAQAQAALESGVTTVRSSGVSNYADVGLRELARSGAIAGPDVLASGYHVRPRMAEEFFLGAPALAGLMAGPGIDSEDQLRSVVRENLAHGVDWIKVMATERAGLPETDPRKQVYTEAQLRAVVAEAAAKDVPVQAHAHGAEGALAAVRAGVRSIEHGTYLDDEALRLMKEKGTYVVPTFSTIVDLTEPGGDYDAPALVLRGRHMLPRIGATVRRAAQLGVPVVTGGDTSYGPSSVTRISGEVAAFVTLGMTPLQALQAATITAAQMLRIEKATGALEAGLDADFVAVEGNPLQDVSVLRDPLLVVSNGKVALERLSFAKRN